MPSKLFTILALLYTVGCTERPSSFPPCLDPYDDFANDCPAAADAEALDGDADASEQASGDGGQGQAPPGDDGAQEANAGEGGADQ
jgi:hypothetical protein